ncbi:MAG: hypothetical protein ACI8R9_000340, partial [Paraglaciecola sp.]
HTRSPRSDLVIESVKERGITLYYLLAYQWYASKIQSCINYILKYVIDLL